MQPLEKTLASVTRALGKLPVETVIASQIAAGKMTEQDAPLARKVYLDLQVDSQFLLKLLRDGEVFAADDKLREGFESILSIWRRALKNEVRMLDLQLTVRSLRPYIVDVRSAYFEAQIIRVEGQSLEFERLISQAKKAAVDIEHSQNRVVTAETAVRDKLGESVATLKEIERAERRAVRRKTSIETVKATADTELKNIKILQSEGEGTVRSIKAIQVELDSLSAGINAHIIKMRSVEAEAQENDTRRNQEKQELIGKLEKTRAQADDILQKSAAASLYSSYNDRKAEISTKVATTRLWLAASMVASVVAAAIVWGISYKYNFGATEQIIAKLGIATPIVYLAVFLTMQYNRERILEEEYASKASMSLSYPAFREELLRLTRDGSDELKAHAVQTAISLSKEIFTDPLKAIKQIEKQAEAVVQNTSKSSSASEDIAINIAQKVGDVLGAATKLIENASKVQRLP